MKKEKTDRLIMVAGGFHARNMARMFEEHGISYLLLAPKIDSIPNETVYHRQMQGDVSWKDYFEIENGKMRVNQGTRITVVIVAVDVEPRRV